MSQVNQHDQSTPLHDRSLTEHDRPWTPGPWTAYNANDETDYFPLWCVANDAFHNPPVDEDEPWIAVELHVGHREDAELVALAPEMAELVLEFAPRYLHRANGDVHEIAEALVDMAEKLRALSRETTTKETTNAT